MIFKPQESASSPMWVERDFPSGVRTLDPLKLVESQVCKEVQVNFLAHTSRQIHKVCLGKFRLEGI